MHTSAFQHIKHNAVYLPFHILPEELPNLLSSLKTLNVKGVNVTVPYKEKIIDHLDWVSPQASALGSVNTLIFEDEIWKGYTTDGNGFVRSLEAEGVCLKGSDILLVGAGGSARSIAVALLEKEISSLTIINRTQKKAEALANLLSSIAPNIEFYTQTSETTKFNILINTTSVGMLDTAIPVENDLIKKSDVIVDIIYNPPMTPLLKTAHSMGKKTLNGLGMLLYQGVDAFEIWTKTNAPVEVMKESLSKSLGLVKN